MAWYNWSQTANLNSNADPTVNWSEGQAPSSINDSARAMMAASAKYRDDISGATVTGGTSTAYTLSTFSQFDTLAHMDKQMVAFTPHTTNGATVTLNVDSNGPKPLRSAPNTELLAGTIISGTPYVALFNNADGAFYLHGFYSNPYNVPLLGGMDFWDTIAPNSSFIFPAGQAISRTVYAQAFARWGTTFGVGNGSTTFNVPDKTGRVSAMMEAAASRLTGAYFGGNSTQIGAAGGGETHTLTINELPAAPPAHGDTTNTLTIAHPMKGSVDGGTPDGTSFRWGNNTGSNTTLNISPTGVVTVTGNLGGGSPHAIVQPTIVCNYIIRII